MNWAERFYKLLFLVVIVTIGARIIVSLLGPTLPSLMVLGVLVVLVRFIFRGPRTKR